MFAITKHCNERAYNAIIGGSLKIGTLSEYRSQEDAPGLMSDREEGISTLEVRGDVANASLKIGSISIEGFSSEGCVRGAIGVGHASDAYVFCASQGAYDRDRHEMLLRGNSEYPSNPDILYYVVFDRDALFSSIEEEFQKNVVGECSFKWGLVKYGDRRFERTLAEMTAQTEPSSSEIIRTIFAKPANFACEEEIRFAIWSSDPVRSAVFLKSERFKNAIVSAGKYSKQMES